MTTSEALTALLGEWLGELLRDLDPDLCHRFNDGSVELVGPTD
jgi:hypothetical protein